MKVFYGLEQVDPPLEASVLTVGNFDGVHVGHQEILRRARVLATGRLPVAAMTFDPHPLSIVAPAKAPQRLMSVAEKVHRLGRAGADIIVVAESNMSLLKMEAERFIDDVLKARFHPKHIVEGPTFGFGKGRKGTATMLREYAGVFGCQVHILDPVTIPDTQGTPMPVSSSAIRSLLREGDVANAARCLGRPYAIESDVVRGAGRGRGIGFPTANIVTPRGQVEPAEGVYAGYTWIAQRRYSSAISIGRAETFGVGPRRVESHLLDFDNDLYHTQIRVEFITQIRGQRGFESAEQLSAQIKQDIELVRQKLREEEAT